MAIRKNIPLVDYTSRDFTSIKEQLRNYRRRYYSNVSRDENQASFDEMVEDEVAYVGDQLNFYLDYSINESFLPTAVEYNNVLKHGRTVGHKFKGNPSSSGIQTFFLIVPANAAGLGPDLAYIPFLKKGTELTSTAGTGFILNEDVNFSTSSNEVVVARVDEDTGTPTSYAIKAVGQIISGRLVEEIISVGDYEKLLRLELAGSDISEIISVQDSNGNDYFEVNYLTQDVVYKPLTNKGADGETVPNILKPFAVPRRFTVERLRNKTFIQFGYGSETDTSSDPIVDPAQVVLDVFGKDHIVDQSFDPTNLLGTDKLGISPANTNLRIVYRINTADNVNASEGSVNNVTNPIFEFDDISNLDDELVRSVVDSIETTNERSITGDVTLPTVDELKVQIFDTFGSQNRAVTNNDYKAISYNMPPKFGRIKRVNIIQDPDSFKRNLNMYVISEDANGSLTTATDTLKQNLKTWILSNKMINDTIDILDAKVVNFGIEFVIKSDRDSNRFDIVNRATERLRDAFQNKYDVGEPIDISKIYKLLNRVEGVVDTLKVNIFQKTGGNYSTTRFDIKSQTSADGTFIKVPRNVIVEVKYPDVDIVGSSK